MEEEYYDHQDVHINGRTDVLFKYTCAQIHTTHKVRGSFRLFCFVGKVP